MVALPYQRFNVPKHMFITVTIKVLSTSLLIQSFMNKLPNTLRLTAILLEKKCKLDYSSYYVFPLKIKLQTSSPSHYFCSLSIFFYPSWGCWISTNLQLVGGYCTMKKIRERIIPREIEDILGHLLFSLFIQLQLFLCFHYINTLVLLHSFVRFFPFLFISYQLSSNIWPLCSQDCLVFLLFSQGLLFLRSHGVC